MRAGFGSKVSWNFIGVATYNFAQYILVIILARLATPSAVGHYALILAVTAPVYLLLGMNLRIALAVDVIRRWPLDAYLWARRICTAFAFGVSIVCGVFVGLRGAELAALCVIATAKGVESYGETVYGWFQLNGKLEYVAYSLLGRATLGASLFTVALLLGGGLPGAGLGLLAGWSITLFGWDLPRARRLRPLVGPDAVGAYRRSGRDTVRLVKEVAPLGLAAGVSSLTVNTPRYAVQGHGGASALGVFSALAYLSQIIALITGAVADGIISSLSAHYSENRKRAFVRTIARLTGFGAGVAAASLLGGWLLGEWLVESLLGREYVNQPLLLVLLLAGAVTTLERSIARGLQASRRYRSIAMIDSVTLVGVVLSCALLVPHFGVLGAAWGWCAGASLGLAIAAIWVFNVVRSFPEMEGAKQA